MGAGVVKPDQHGIRIHIHTGSRSSRRTSHQSSADLKCEECLSKLAHRMIHCLDCERKFCWPCSIQTKPQCKKCHILLSGNFSRPQLREWKPKDLKALLHKHNINTANCREKDDLIDLIFTRFGKNSNFTGNSTSQNQNQRDNRESENGTQRSTSQTNFPRTDTQSSNLNEPSLSSENQSTQETENVNQSNPTSDINTEEITTAMEEITHIKLEDIRSEEHIDQLSIKCLKRLLLNNFVDYKGCCERWELQERVKRLWAADQKNKQIAEEQRKVYDNPSTTSSDPPSNGEEDICKICMDAAIDCVLLECGHMVTCTNCGKRLSECPICRQYVVRAVHIFKA